MLCTDGYHICSLLLLACSHLWGTVCRATRAETVPELVEGPVSESSKLSSEFGSTQSQAAALASSGGSVSLHTSQRHTPASGSDLALPAGQHVCSDRLHILGLLSAALLNINCSLQHRKPRLITSSSSPCCGRNDQ